MPGCATCLAEVVKRGRNCLALGFEKGKGLCVSDCLLSREEGRIVRLGFQEEGRKCLVAHVSDCLLSREEGNARFVALRTACDVGSSGE